MRLSVVETAPPAATAPRPTEDGASADIEDVRARLFGIAHRVLGRAADAEDVVQDVWVRWEGTDRAQVRDRVAFLVTVTTRVALNAATSARARREVSAGAGLSERRSAAPDPAQGVERGDELRRAVRLLLERLSPAERAVHVLREAFDYPFREIAQMLGTSEANARQLARRARTHLAEQRRAPVDPAEADRLLAAFLAAARAGEMAGLIDLLTDAIDHLGPAAQAS
jgi:RNA polymerase sigma factor (sigma-70 family)